LFSVGEQALLKNREPWCRVEMTVKWYAKRFFTYSAMCFVFSLVGVLVTTLLFVQSVRSVVGFFEFGFLCLL
jgi:hypothetical protein